MMSIVDYRFFENLSTKRALTFDFYGGAAI
jgi:hypothetical protein